MRKQRAPVSLGRSPTVVGPSVTQPFCRRSDGWRPAGLDPRGASPLGTRAPRARRKQGRTDAGRSRYRLLVRVCVADDANAARQWRRRELTGYAMVAAYQRYFRRIGFAYEAEAVLTQWRAGDRL